MDGQDIVVWDIHNDLFYRHTLDYSPPTVMTILQGWVIFSLDFYIDTPFSICDVILDNCKDYSFPRTSHVYVQEDGQMILSQHFPDDSDVDPLMIWTRQTDGHYELEMVNDVPMYYRGAEGLNATGDKLIGRSASQNTLQVIGVWTVPELDLVFEISNLDVVINPQWLSNKFILIFGIDKKFTDNLALYLFEVGNSTPIDTLDLNDLDELKNIYEYYIGLPQGEGVYISQDKQWVILNLGWALLAIPIEYQSQ